MHYTYMYSTVHVGRRKHIILQCQYVQNVHRRGVRRIFQGGWGGAWIPEKGYLPKTKTTLQEDSYLKFLLTVNEAWGKYRFSCFCFKMYSKIEKPCNFFYIPNSRKEKTCESVSKSHPTPTFSRFLFSKNGSDFAEIFVWNFKHFLRNINHF